MKIHKIYLKCFKWKDIKPLNFNLLEKCVSEPKQLSIALKYGRTTHLQLNLLKIKEECGSVLIYTQCASLKHI